MGNSAKSLALGWLTRRSLTTRELRDRLTKKGCGSQEIDEVLKDLDRLGLMDDKRLGEQIVASGLSHYEGPMRIVARLASRGVPGPMRRQLYHELLAGNNWQEIALHVRERYDITNAKDRARFIRHLTREGFPTGIIRDLAGSVQDFVDDGMDEG